MRRAAPSTPAQVVGRWREPVLFSGLAAEWKALKRWTPELLAGIADGRQVRLVVGDREGHAPVFETMPLKDFLSIWAAPQRPDRPAYYLKEYDLLTEFPALAADLDLSLLTFPRTQSW